jgi:Tfp pilus assembly protein FimT
MISTFTVRMQNKFREPVGYKGLTLIELLFSLVLVILFVGLAVPNLFGLLRKNTFRAGIRDFVSTMQKAVTAASESNRRYEVIIDIDEQYYLLRQITSSDFTQILDEEIIIDNNFSEKCLVSYVFFDDGTFTNDGRAKFRAGHGGWQYGGKIVLLDEDDNPYTVVINRINRTIELHEGEIDIALPKRQEDVFF